MPQPFLASARRFTCVSSPRWSLWSGEGSCPTEAKLGTFGVAPSGICTSKGGTGEGSAS